ncbi:magnesium transporter CorA family protein [Lactococcus lactis]
MINLMKIERSLIYFIMSLKSNSLVISKIKSGKYLKLYDDEKELLDDLMIEVDQAFDMSNISNRILNEMTDSYDSIINNNTNSVMKFLTSYSIILTIPTIIFSFYGMNVPLPLTNLPKYLGKSFVY